MSDISHVYAVGTPSSSRVRLGVAVMQEEMDRELPIGDRTAKRERSKTMKREEFMKVESPTPADMCFTREQLDEAHHFFKSNEEEDLVMIADPQKKPRCIANYLFDSVEIVDCNNLEKGIEFFDIEGIPIFFKAPRNVALDSQGRVCHSQVEALEHFIVKKAATKRSEGRSGQDGAPYATMGATAPQGGKSGTGITQGAIPKKSNQQWNVLQKMMKTMEDVAQRILPPHLLRAYWTARSHVDYPTMKKRANTTKKQAGTKKKRVGEAVTKILAAMAFSKNYHSAGHTDEDYWFSIFTVSCLSEICTEAVGEKTGYKKDCPVALYFVFPKVGKAVAMRPGDVLIFNAQEDHCCASKTAAYKNEDVYTTSFYIKSNIAGGHDNSVPLTEEQEMTLYIMENHNH